MKYICIILALVLLGCSKKEYPNPESYIVGKWHCTLNDSLLYPNYTFLKDGSCYCYGWFPSTKGSYKLTGYGIDLEFQGRINGCSIQKQTDKIIIVYNCLNNKWSTYVK